MGRIREKSCGLCGESAPVLYRVQIDPSGEWRFVCDRCWPAVREDNPDYTYGGTWKAKKRH
jgi:alpha-D-ribose 1-methylphosphonate 5-phosphate C-P lyase